MTIIQISCKAAILHVDALLTHYFCNTGESHGRCSVDSAFFLDLSLTTVMVVSFRF